MRTCETGRIFDVRRFSTHDGGGIRTTVFFKGCPLRCAWCHNPEGIPFERRPVWVSGRCMGCGDCASTARDGGVRAGDGGMVINPKAQEEWDALMDGCPTGALRWDSRDVRADELMAELRRDAAFFAHGGGVTLSGGDPLMQPGFAREILLRCRAEGIHTAVETELEAARKASEFHRKALREIRTELSSAAGYAELGRRQGAAAEDYLEKIQSVLGSMESTIACTLGEPLGDEPAGDEAADIKALAGKRVLLVDDNELNREVMKAMLVGHGLMVEESCNGSEAVAAVRANAPGYYQFLLMDSEMPVMDGFEATVCIRSLPNRIRANTPIIALTVNAVPENRERAAVVGMDDFLVKPTSSARLLRSLAKLQ